eukprot:2944997-Amphidinium_carterae.1
MRTHPFAEVWMCQSASSPPARMHPLAQAQARAVAKLIRIKGGNANQADCLRFNVWQTRLLL